MASHSTVSIDNDFATGDTGVAFRTADDEASGRVNQVSRLFIEPFGRHYLFDEQFGQRFVNFFLFNVGRVLSGNDHCGSAHRFVSVVFN